MQEIDIDKVLIAKAPKIAPKVPRFAINYLKRIVHQEELNSIIRDYHQLPPLEFVRATLKSMNISYYSTGMEKIDKSGRYLFASNHPFGGLDGLMLAEEISKTLSDTKLIVNDILMYIEPLKPIFVPVNKHGKQSALNVDAFNAAFAADHPLITFPAGLCSRRIKGEVVDLEWKTNFIKKAITYKRDVVPVYFDGKLSNFFYNLSSLRKKLGVKVNIEMLYLVDEMFKQGGSTFEIRVGEPISYQRLAECKNLREAVEIVRKETYNLRKK